MATGGRGLVNRLTWLQGGGGLVNRLHMCWLQWGRVCGLVNILHMGYRGEGVWSIDYTWATSGRGWGVTKTSKKRPCGL